jgi:hypothetical protein
MRLEAWFNNFVTVLRSAERGLESEQSLAQGFLQNV